MRCLERTASCKGTSLSTLERSRAGGGCPGGRAYRLQQDVAALASDPPHPTSSRQRPAPRWGSSARRPRGAAKRYRIGEFPASSRSCSIARCGSLRAGRALDLSPYGSHRERGRAPATMRAGIAIVAGGFHGGATAGQGQRQRAGARRRAGAGTAARGGDPGLSRHAADPPLRGARRPALRHGLHRRLLPSLHRPGSRRDRPADGIESRATR